ncbi:MAG: glycosyltransferase, partial [Flavobacteriales bacterium]|nr:glycosyltransferase [Flavobacteriales bacterium]
HLIEKYRLDAVISDNRFGLYSDKVPCVYITHQVMIKAPFFEPLLHRLHKGYMNRFSQTWIPDHAENGLSGDLSQQYPLPENGTFIGPLTRFHQKETALTRDVLVLISGPEPQRTRFEKMVLSQLENFSGTAMAVLGTPEKHTDRKDSKGHRIVSHLPADEMETAISQARLIISRSGYSTIMDLSVLGKKAVFVPTPGQTEQEYLGKKYHTEKKHLLMLQKDFDLRKAWSESDDFSGFASRSSKEFKPALEDFIGSLSST